ncbi:MAG TPA: bifunctional diaminohydroxyphosphoribosylaminopyrimidine deaminase/5-amino-6-(5-phosphoribosylamino)uracil reductase RibD, partial [Oceanospirillales bacterium]|nr:bifunctional diaminohydroxyphosphoribosylaminopyrimidine deaminase/5-amino-6-(5-phosphoribosylamino)uracil reductase RibD [Oceanospirillales bacterium]
MADALRLAKKGLYTTSPNPRVGCVIVKDGVKVGEGWHQKAGEPHAEVHALRAAGDQARGATAYVTLEPCSHYGRTPPCAEGLIKAGVSRVVGAVRDPNPSVAGRGYEMLRQAGIEVVESCLEPEATAINAGFMKRMRTGMPYVRVKLAMSLDGRTAMASGESQWITGSAARRDVQALRAQSCAVITGADSVIIDNPSMTVRPDEAGLDIPEGLRRQPLRVIVDGAHRVSNEATIFDKPGDILIAARTPPASLINRDTGLGALSYWAGERDEHTDIDALLRHLA